MSRVKSIFGTTPTKMTATTEEGLPAFDRPLEEVYLQTLLTNTFGSTFYVSDNDLIQRSDEIHDKMLAKNPAWAAKAMIYSRNQGYMRTQPTYGLAKLSRIGNGKPKLLFRSIFDKVILTPNDLLDFMTMVRSLSGGEGGRAVKNAVGDWLNSNMSEYWLIKYGSRNNGYTLHDVMITVHPKTRDKIRNMMYRYLVTGEINVELSQLVAFYKFTRAETEAEKLKWITEGHLPHEVVTGAGGLTTKVWEQVAQYMPPFALLRNLATLERNNALTPAVRNRIFKVFNDKELIGKSKILPFRFLDAMNQVHDGPVCDALRMALDHATSNLPEIPGRSAIFVDQSGSMAGRNIEIAGVFGVSMYKKTKSNAIVWGFDSEGGYWARSTGLYEHKLSLIDSTLTQAAYFKAQGGTDCGLPMRRLTACGEKVDTIIMITDEQQNSGSSFYDSLNAYKSRVNRNVKTFIVNVAPYRGALTPTEKNCWHIYGWSDRVLSFISMAAEGFDSMAATIR